MRTPGLPPPAAERARMEPDGPAPRDAQAFIAALDQVDLLHGSLWSAK
jgi:hypothetical protein